jgi:hypothetical protein
MTTGMMKWTTSLVLGLFLFTAGCGEKKSDGDTSQSQVGVAPSSPPEAAGPENIPSSSVGSEQNSSGSNKEQNQETGRKS